MHDYLTSKEVADLLRIKERKLYDLVAEGRLPVTRATGKLLFPRTVLAAWLEGHTNLGSELKGAVEPPAVVAGSHDPLLEWSLREADTGLATFFNGSGDGLQRLAAGKAMAAGLHLAGEDGGSGNAAAVAAALPLQPVVLIEWAQRSQGLVVPAGNPKRIVRLADLAGLTLIGRQPGAGSQGLLARLLDRVEGLADDLRFTRKPALNETDVAQAVAAGAADAGLAIEAVARQYRLDFVPLASERFDVALARRDYFGEPLQKLWAFARSARFREYASELGGYDVSATGDVRYNGP
jgi:putative molybdopterin biosynthesis protein